MLELKPPLTTHSILRRVPDLKCETAVLDTLLSSPDAAVEGPEGTCCSSMAPLWPLYGSSMVPALTAFMLQELS